MDDKRSGGGKHQKPRPRHLSARRREQRRRTGNRTEAGWPGQRLNIAANVEGEEMFC